MSERENQILFEERLTSFADAAIVQTEKEQESNSQRSTGASNGLAICTVVGFQDDLPLLKFELSGSTHVYKAIAIVGGADNIGIGAQVCAAFDQGRCDRPMVLGTFTCDTSKQLASNLGTQITDENQITLKCGKASISLKSDGTVAIRGTNVASRATQTNRIRGGNVQIN